MKEPEYCFFGFVWQGWANCMTKAEWAAWVQALGAIAALIVAWLVLLRQSRQAAHLHERQLGHATYFEHLRTLDPKLTRLRTAASIVGRIASIAQAALAASHSELVAFIAYRANALPIDELTLGRTMKALERLDNDPEVSGEMVLLLTEASLHMWAVRETLTLLRNMPPDNPPGFLKTADSLKLAVPALAISAKRIQAEVERVAQELDAAAATLLGNG